MSAVLAGGAGCAGCGDGGDGRLLKPEYSIPDAAEIRVTLTNPGTTAIPGMSARAMLETIAAGTSDLGVLPNTARGRLNKKGGT